MSTTKKKTLYGRYDDYAPPDDTQDGEGSRRGSHAVRLMGLSPAPEGQRRGKPIRATTPAPPPQSSAPRAKRVTPHGQESETRTTRVMLPMQKSGTVILRVTAAEGEPNDGLLTVTVELSGEDGSRERRDILLSAEQYTELRVHPGGISPEETERLMTAGELCRAIRRGLALLEYGDMSTRTLTAKLTRRGIPREVAEEATRWLAGRGFLQEESAALSRAVEGARKGWGLRRIQQDLLAHGYPPPSVETALGALSDPDDPAFVDFYASCLTQLRRRLGRGAPPPTDRAAREKLTAALLRQGFSMDEIREAMREQANTRS